MKPTPQTYPLQHVQMSPREYQRVRVIERLVRRDLRLKQAAEALDLCPRQVRILKVQFLAAGPAGLVSRRRGRRSNRALPDAVRRSALHLVRQSYGHLGPTRACEHLANRHGIKISPSTLSAWMTAEGLWQRQRRQSKPTSNLLKPDAGSQQLRYVSLFGDWVLDTENLVAIAEGSKGRKRLDLIWHEGTICWYGTYGHLGGRQLQAVLDAVRTLLCPDKLDALHWYVPRPAA